MKTFKIFQEDIGAWVNGRCSSSLGMSNNLINEWKQSSGSWFCALKRVLQCHGLTVSGDEGSWLLRSWHAFCPCRQARPLLPICMHASDNPFGLFQGTSTHQPFKSRNITFSGITIRADLIDDERRKILLNPLAFKRAKENHGIRVFKDSVWWQMPAASCLFMPYGDEFKYARRSKLRSTAHRRRTA